MGKWFLYQNDKVKAYLTMQPTYIETLPPLPKEWSDLHLGGITVELPLARYQKIRGMETQIYFFSESGEMILISDLALGKELAQVFKDKKLKYPLVPYQDKLAIFKSSPSDIFFFNSRNRNEKGTTNQILKLMSVPTGGLGEVIEVNPKMLKAICIISEKREKGYTGWASIYSQNETMTFSLFLMNYKDKAALRSDLLSILGGLSMPDQPQDAERIKIDINTIVKEYNRTEQNAQPDSQ